MPATGLIEPSSGTPVPAPGNSRVGPGMAVADPGCDNMQPMPEAIRFEGVERRYGRQRVLTGVTFNVRAGEYVGLVGVNGAGKTTTIGKLARRYKDEGRSLMLAAGDTFRAAAVAQLQAWGERNGVAVVAQGQNADAASVAFDALQAARARGIDVLIADTAGRLHTQGGLMDELAKVARVLRKLDPEAPHEVLMVIDGTTGQNAINQVRKFSEKLPVTGLVVTKLDGTARGGVLVAAAEKFGLPVHFVGVGEQADDLQPFDAAAFARALAGAE